MNWLDIIIILILIIPTYIGFRKGFVGTATTLVAIILGIIIAGIHYSTLADWLHPGWMESRPQANLIAFIIIFILALIAIMIIFSVLRKYFQMSLTGRADKIGGLIAGLLIGAMISSVILAIVAKFFPSAADETMNKSTLAPFLLDKFPFILHVLPDEFDAVRQLFG